MKKPLLLILFSIILLPSCSYVVPVNYSPSNLYTGSGTISVEPFSYSAAQKGSVKPNQPEKNPAALGEVYISNDFDVLFTNAVRKELRFSGYKLSKKTSISVSGTIDRFYYNWVGLLNQSIELIVTFKIKIDGKDVFNQKIRSFKEVPKATGYDTEAIKLSISECILGFIKTAQDKHFF